MTPEDHHRYFYESQSPVGGVLLAGFESGGQWIAAMQAYRRDASRPFQPADVEFLQRSGSTIGDGLGNAQKRELGVLRRQASDEPRASGVLLLDRNGRIRFTTPAGSEWLDLIRKLDREPTGALPTALWSAMFGVGRGSKAFSATTVRASTPDGLVMVEASPADASGAIAIVISSECSAGGGPIPHEWDLTRQQRAVTAQILSGMSNREIAAALCVSEHTVEWHLRQIYGRLGVRSRSQLQARYFREVVAREYFETGT